MEIIAHPVTRFADRIRFLRWRRVPLTPVYEAEFRLAGEKKWSHPVSLRTAEWEEAKEKARDLLAEREARAAHGIPEPTRVRKTTEPVERDDLFRTVADEVVKEMIAHREDLARRHGRGSGKANTVAVHISAIRNRLTPAFGDIPIPDLDGETVNTWAREFEVIARRGPEKGRLVPLSKSHIGSLNHSLQLVLDRAVQKKIIKEHNKPAISQKGLRFRKAQANPTFTFPEMEMLRDHMTDAWVEAGGGRMWEQEASVEVRYLLRAYIALGACTGIRGGEEMELILPRQVLFEKAPQDDGRLVETIRIPILAHQGKYRDRAHGVRLHVRRLRRHGHPARPAPLARGARGAQELAALRHAVHRQMSELRPAAEAAAGGGRHPRRSQDRLRPGSLLAPALLRHAGADPAAEGPDLR